MDLSLEIAERILEGAIAAAKDAGMKPLTIVVLDAGGHPVALKRQDKATFLRADIATAKAWTALGLDAPSRFFQDMAEQRPHFAGSLSAISCGRMAPAAGGVLVQKDGETIGAVGVSGDTPDNDEKAALAGVAATGLV